jgi:arylsulfatase A-like enzyme/cytochrome c-type biogenesis protein CcmH/NrfG
MALLGGLAFLVLPLQTQTDSRPNLVLVSIDTLRADHLGCYGYKLIQTPHIDRLAGEGVRFNTVVCQVPLTLPSHCTILTGTYPAYHGVRDNVGYKLPESRTTLATILKTQGYQTAAFIGAYVLNSKFGLSRGFDYYDDQIAGSSGLGPVVNLNSVERRAGEVVSRTTSWMDAHPRTPFFVWIHLYDPHDPYEPPSPFKEKYKERPYDGEIAYVDQELGRFLEFLKQKGLYEKTVVVLVSDHGESFGEHQEWTHGYFIYDTTLLVPLIVKPIEKGLTGRSVAEQVSLVDVVPTVLQLLDLPRPAELQGQGMLGLMLGKSGGWSGLAYCESYYPAQFGWSPLIGIRRENAKFIRAPKPEFYDLHQDPGEKTNRILQQSALANELKATLSKLESNYADRSGSRAARLELSSQQLDELRALGYVGISTARGPGGNSPSGTADPKDKREVYQMISASSQDVAAGRYRQAMPVLEKVLQTEPGMRIAWSMLGRCYFQLSRFEPAKKAFQEILKQQPQNLDAQFYVAACDYRQKNWVACEAGFKKLLEQDRNFAPAHLYLGFLYQAKGDTDSALASFQRVLELEPENEDAHAKVGFLLASRAMVQEAVPHFQKVIQLNPGDAEAHANLGVAYLKLNQVEMAGIELAEACRLSRKYCRPPAGKAAVPK